MYVYTIMQVHVSKNNHALMACWQQIPLFDLPEPQEATKGCSRSTPTEWNISFSSSGDFRVPLFLSTTVPYGIFFADGMCPGLIPIKCNEYVKKMPNQKEPINYK